MFLSKKLFFSTWTPLVEEKFSSVTSAAASGTFNAMVTLSVTANKIFFVSGVNNVRSVQIENAASTQTDIVTSMQNLFAEGDSTTALQVFYGSSYSSSDIKFRRIEINISAETATPVLVTKTWSHSQPAILTMFGNNIVWSNTASSTSSRYTKFNETTLVSNVACSYVGKPNSTSVIAQNGNTLYTISSAGTAAVLFNKAQTGNVRCVSGRYFMIAYPSATTLTKLSSAGVIEWTKEFYADEAQTVPLLVRFLGFIDDKLYAVSCPTNTDSTSAYNKLTLMEIHMDTGDILNTYVLPTPRVVTEGITTLYNTISYSMGNFNLGIAAINKRFALPLFIKVHNSVFYHDWFIITIP